MIELPWPDPSMSPNARRHWSVVSKAKKAARTESALIAKAAPRPSEPVSLSITFHAPTKRAYDLDNILARCKASLDGLADAWGIDDSTWALSIQKGEPVKNGKVRIEYEAADA